MNVVPRVMPDGLFGLDLCSSAKTCNERLEDTGIIGEKLCPDRTDRTIVILKVNIVLVSHRATW